MDMTKGSGVIHVNKYANGRKIPFEKLVDLMIEGAGQTAPTVGYYARNESGNPIALGVNIDNVDRVHSTCALGAVMYAAYNNGYSTTDFWASIRPLLQKFEDKYGTTIDDYNDDYGRDAAIKACKDLL